MLPVTESTLVVRTDFADPDAWARVRRAVAEPPGRDLISAAFTFVDDPAHAGLSPRRALELVPPRPSHPMIALADSVTMSSPYLPLLVVDLADDPGGTFRSAPEVLWHVASSLFVAPGYFHEYVRSVDPDGIYRCGGRDGQIKVLSAIASLKGVPFDADDYDFTDAPAASRRR
ncbi:DUF6924 domain-containing protein [Catenuloplanes atrovinosus]|uniref:DUF6924 domain-containing protein n=1 Tax=Catenuloplanes atrovinosus TaxID=137266 RepID=A0AAE3YKF6_9ACTN|nr:hypothetical protein [Catenuloplanes atrovinosus]MDR7275090.1 hypothetical protein [Catenuloplanes atrovinosus]